MKTKFLIFSLFISLVLSTCLLAETVMTTTETAVGATSTKILNSRMYRKFLLIQNRGAQAIHIKTQTVHGGGEVGLIVPAGGSWAPVQAPVDAIWSKSSSATSDITMIEGQ